DGLVANTRAVPQEMVEKSLVPADVSWLRTLWEVVQKSQRRERALCGFGPRDKPAFCPNSVGRQAETNCSDRRKGSARIPVGDEPRFRVCRLPEPPERSLLQVVQKRGSARVELYC